MNELVRSPRGRPGDARPIAAFMLEDSDERRAFLERALLRPGQVAALFQVSRRTVSAWASAGLLESIETPGGHRRFRAEEVRRLIDAMTVRPSRTWVPLGWQPMIRVERDGGVAEVRLDAPPLNLLGSEMIAALRGAFEDLAAEPPPAVVLRCAGGGADVREMARFDESSARAFITALHHACRAIRLLDAPVIAAIDGPCAGAHVEVAAACDMRVAAHAARFAMPEIAVGIPSVIDAWWIVQLCGPGAAAALFFDGGFVTAAEAHRIGLVDRVAADAGVEALAWARRIAAWSPVALAQQKRVMRDWTQDAYERAAAASIERFAETIRGGQAAEAMRAMLEKRSPVFEKGEA